MAGLDSLDSHHEPSSGAMHSGDRAVLGVESKQRMADENEAELETVETIDPDVLKTITENFLSKGIARDNATWDALFDEIVMERLKEKDMRAWMHETRRRGFGSNPDGGVPVDRADGQESVGEPGDEDETGEGRAVRGPIHPYVPTEKERQEHNRTHYPHRTWCECRVAGRAVAGVHSRNREDSDPNACEFHFDYCFLKNAVKYEPVVTLVGVDKSSNAIVAHVVPEQ